MFRFYNILFISSVYLEKSLIFLTQCLIGSLCLHHVSLSHVGKLRYLVNYHFTTSYKRVLRARPGLYGLIRQVGYVLEVTDEFFAVNNKI